MIKIQGFAWVIAGTFLVAGCSTGDRTTGRQIAGQRKPTAVARKSTKFSEGHRVHRSAFRADGSVTCISYTELSDKEESRVRVRYRGAGDEVYETNYAFIGWTQATGLKRVKPAGSSFSTPIHPQTYGIAFYPINLSSQNPAPKPRLFSAIEGQLVTIEIGYKAR